MAAAGDDKLARNRGEDQLHLISEPDQDRDRDHGNKSQDQGVLDKSLPPLVSRLATKWFPVMHEIIISVSELLSARRQMNIV